LSSKRKGKGGFENRVAILLGPAGVKKRDIRWSKGTAYITCPPGKEVEVRRIIGEIRNTKVRLEVSVPKQITPCPGIVPAAPTTAAAASAT